MDSILSTTIDSRTCPSGSEETAREEELFNAVESNVPDIVKTFNKDELLKLCEKRRSFSSEWSFPDEELQTAYQRACLLGRTAIVKYMLDVGVPVNQGFEGGDSSSTTRSAFLFACQSHSMPTIKLLLDAGAPVNEHGSCSVDYARRFLSSTKVPFLRGITHTGRETGWEIIFPIHFAILYDDCELSNLLITSTTNNLYMMRKFTPLHVACILNRSLALIKVLITANDSDFTLTSKTQNGMYADELTTSQVIIDYLRPKRIASAIEIERKHQQDHEEELNNLRDGTGFQVFLLTLTGRTLSIVVKKTDTVKILKMKIDEHVGMPIDQQRILYSGKQLEDDRTIGDYDITKNANLFLLMRLVGGWS